jgi:cystathionine beta-lyase
MIWVETPTNPLMKLADIAAIATITSQKNILLAVDNTFASPYLQGHSIWELMWLCILQQST